MFAAGGTGGHIFPALALARYLRAEGGHEILFVGTDRGMEKDIVPEAGFNLEKIPVIGLERRLSLKLGKAVLLAFKGLYKAYRLIKSFKPDVVVGTGGYVAGPVLLAAVISRLPTVIHEQNAIPGFTNVSLARWVDRVCLSIPGSECYFPGRSRMVVTGNPRATEAVEAAKKSEKVLEGLQPGVPLLLCVGGSHGAARLNEAFSGSLETILGESDVQVVYITGQRYYNLIKDKLSDLDVRFPHRLHVLPFHSRLPELLADTSLIISRAGATTLAEITALGVPAILVPSPNVTNNHQEHNARVLKDGGAAVLILESELDMASLASHVVEMLKERQNLFQMAEASRKLGFPDAASRMAGVLEEVRKN